ncbi:MAG: hypothetical protein NTW86_11350 [Candidatus Sumerlaeota bacterium]|nr:hypothetical protein [Candidatus Sumerlaeota bacterium]
MNNRNVVKGLRFFLGAVCALIALALGVQAYSLRSTEQTAQKAVELREQIAPAAAAAVSAPDVDKYKDLAKSNLFYPAQKKEYPAPKLEGLLGGYALIDGRLHGEGDDVNGWKIASISENDIKVQREEDGEKIEQTVKLFEDRDTLEIDNRPKNQQHTPDVKGFSGPEGGDIRSRLAELRDRLSSQGGGASPGGGAFMDYMSRYGRGSSASGAFVSQYAAQIEQLSDDELEQLTKQRFGGTLPPGVNADTIRQYVRGLSQTAIPPSPGPSKSDYGKKSSKGDYGHKSKSKR